MVAGVYLLVVRVFSKYSPENENEFACAHFMSDLLSDQERVVRANTHLEGNVKVTRFDWVITYNRPFYLQWMVQLTDTPIFAIFDKVSVNFQMSVKFQNFEKWAFTSEKP